MTPSERQIVAIEPGKKVDLRYDRKVGRRIEGRVTGLGDAEVPLRLRHDRISRAGGRGWGQARRNRGCTPASTRSRSAPTAASAPRRSRPTVTSSGSPRCSPPRRRRTGRPTITTAIATIDVPETGELPALEIVAGAEQDRPDRRAESTPRSRALEVRAFDEAGVPIRDFEARLYGPPNRSPEAIGVDGLAVMGSATWDPGAAGELIVTAPGSPRISARSERVEGLRKLDVVLKRGTKVLLRVRDRQGVRSLPP